MDRQPGLSSFHFTNLFVMDSAVLIINIPVNETVLALENNPWPDVTGTLKS